ncbi:MAG: folate family ECF transporter S component [Clostridia bacterium]|nr:folate family ECF transporter S component [Clostridia bacterium]
MSKAKKHIIRLAVTAALVAVAVVLSRFCSLNMWNMSIGISFVPIMLCGMLFGPLWGGICGAAADFIGAVLFPFGTYFPGFTAVAFLSGTLFGLMGTAAHRMKGRWSFLGMAAVIITVDELVCSLLLNSVWITLLYGSPYIPTMVSRIPKAAIMLLLQVPVAFIIKQFVYPPVKRMLQN